MKIKLTGHVHHLPIFSFVISDVTTTNITSPAVISKLLEVYPLAKKARSSLQIFDICSHSQNQEARTALISWRVLMRGKQKVVVGKLNETWA